LRQARVSTPRIEAPERHGALLSARSVASAAVGRERFPRLRSSFVPPLG
jgi:hypothetical protein